MIVISNDLFNKRNLAKDDNILEQLLNENGIKDFSIVFVSHSPEKRAKKLIPDVVEKGNIIYECSRGRRNQDKLSPKMLKELVEKYNTENHIVIFEDFIDSVNVYDKADCRFQSLMHELRTKRCTCLVGYNVQRFRGITDKNINWSYRKGKSGVAKRFHIDLRNPENSYIINLEKSGHFKGYDPRQFRDKRCPKIRKEYELFQNEVAANIDALKSFVATLQDNFFIFEECGAERYDAKKGVFSIKKGSQISDNYWKNSRRARMEGWFDFKTNDHAKDEKGGLFIPKAVVLEYRTKDAFDRRIFNESTHNKKPGMTIEEFAIEHVGITPLNFLRFRFFDKDGLIAEKDKKVTETNELKLKDYDRRYTQMKDYYDGNGNRYRDVYRDEIGYEFQALGDIFDGGARVGLTFDETIELILQILDPKVFQTHENLKQQKQETEQETN